MKNKETNKKSNKPFQVAWQGRCLELEESLSRFREQAHRIREVLKEKVSHDDDDDDNDDNDDDDDDRDDDDTSSFTNQKVLKER